LKFYRLIVPRESILYSCKYHFSYKLKTICQSNIFYKKSKKERATDIPSWAHGSRPKKGESGNEYAIRKMNEHYGKGKWARKGKQGKEYSELRKWGDRGR
jgi:hypothetical protein